MIFGMSYFQLFLIAAAGIGLVVTNAGPVYGLISSGLSKLGKAKTAATTDGVPTRMEVLADLDAASRYFESVKCKDGMDAIQTAVTHAFAQHSPTGEHV